jgi:predicted RNA-binding Zn-ribbon protein involved in translation (DUF1610 family)
MARQWPLHVCPKCGSGEVDRAPRVRTLDRLARLFGRRVYRCRECRRRFYDRPTPRKIS